MRISKYVHSCLLVENGDGKILFDPGKFSFADDLVKPEQFRDLTAVIVTHYHPDHADPDAIKTILRHNPASAVLANAEIVRELATEAIPAEIFESGARSVGGFRITAHEAAHAPLLGAPSPRNTAYCIDELFLNPGDSLAADSLQGVKARVLALPVMAPWATELNTAEFARRLAPERVAPVHDGYSKDFFLQQRYRNFQKYFAAQGIGFEWLDKPGSYLDIG